MIDHPESHKMPKKKKNTNSPVPMHKTPAVSKTVRPKKRSK